jgi:hypothetical protein
MHTRLVIGSIAIAMWTALSGCESTQIAIKESFGYAKREQLVDKVQTARDGQQEAKQQFQSALEQFLAVTNVRDGSLSELEKHYNDLKREYERSKSRADAVHDRIASVEAVAKALFKEWDGELDQYQNTELRKASEEQLKNTQRQYDQLIAAMKAAEGRMAPVLGAFNDQVLFLKHNLNARAISSLQTTAHQLQGDVSTLVKDMEASINQADAFIKQMQTQGS